MIKRYSYLLETALFSGIVLAVGAVQGNAGFVGNDLHPFYFVILLMVIRYGYLKGFVSILSSGGLYFAFYLITLGGIQPADFGDAAVVLAKIRASGFQVSDLWGPCYHPLAFLAFGMFVGLLIEEDKKKIAALQQTIARHEQAIDGQQQQTADILKINDELSNQIITSALSFNVLFQKTRPLLNEDTAGFYAAAYHLLRIILYRADGYIFHRDDGGLRCAYPDEDDTARQVLAQHAERLEAIIQYHQFFRVDMFGDEELTPSAPILAGPIFHQASDTVYGIIAVTTLDITCYNDNTYRIFRNFCRWLGDICYFREGHRAEEAPLLKTRREFAFLAEFGASKSEIQQLMQEAFHQDA